MGEVSEGQRPRLTLAGERVMTGHSLLGPRTRTTGSRIHHPLRTTDPSSGAEARTTGSTETRQRRGSSPGQLSQSAGLSLHPLFRLCLLTCTPHLFSTFRDGDWHRFGGRAFNSRSRGQHLRFSPTVRKGSQNIPDTGAAILRWWCWVVKPRYQSPDRQSPNPIASTH